VIRLRRFVLEAFSMNGIRFPALLAALCLIAGCGTPSFLVTPISNTNELEEVTVAPGKGFSPSKVAIIEVEGMLINARSGGFLQPTENKLSLFTQQMDRAANDPSVKAVVLRINSPGGTVVCSDTMYEMVRTFRAKTHKPVVADTQEVAASGAYYVACGCDKIVAHPTSLVGSIGVIFEEFEVTGLMQKVGVKSNAITSGPHKEMGSPFKKLEPDERAIMQHMVDEFYARFKGVVMDSRHISDENVKDATDGRVFSGAEAQRIGLVDQIGLLDDALDLARDMGHAPGAEVIMYKRPFGYSGSIYSSGSTPAPQASELRLKVPGMPDADESLPEGFYYLWQPGM
jgi:protease IV